MKENVTSVETISPRLWNLKLSLKKVVDGGRIIGALIALMMADELTIYKQR
jgi:hypothetical protein